MENKQYSPILRDLTGRILITTDLPLTREIIRILVLEKEFDSTPLKIGSTSIVKDIQKAVKNGIYKTIFLDKKNLKKIISIVKDVELTASLISELKKIQTKLPDTYNHILMVCTLSVKIWLDLNKNASEAAKISRIGLVHDLGKSRLPAEILEKKTPLTDEEFRIIQEHPMIEYLLLSHYLKNPRSYIALACFSHHERLDGSGYPRGIKELDDYVQTIIPCDIFDALISHRPYRNEPFTVRAALDLLLEESKKGKLNKKFVKCLISYVRKDKPHYKNIKLAKPDRDPPPKINYYGIREKK